MLLLLYQPEIVSLERRAPVWGIVPNLQRSRKQRIHRVNAAAGDGPIKSFDLIDRRPIHKGGVTSMAAMVMPGFLQKLDWTSANRSHYTMSYRHRPAPAQ